MTGPNPVRTRSLARVRRSVVGAPRPTSSTSRSGCSATSRTPRTSCRRRSAGCSIATSRRSTTRAAGSIVVVSRICVDQLRSARTRRETGAPIAETAHDGRGRRARFPIRPIASRSTTASAWRCSSCLQQLSPAERAVFVLHDVFQFSFDAVGSIVDRTPAACRQLASRARHRIEAETGPNRFEPDLGRAATGRAAVHRGVRRRRRRRARRAPRSRRGRRRRPRTRRAAHAAPRARRRSHPTCSSSSDRRRT